jgi:hypothetical protein
MGILKKYMREVGPAFESSKGYIFRQRWTAPLLGTTTAVHAAVTGTGAIITTTTGITNPDFARVLSITLVGTTVSGNVVINGTDIRGNSISDTIAMGAAGTYAGVLAFATVTSFVLPAAVTSGTTVSVGTTAALGLARMMDADEYISGSVASSISTAGVYEATRATVTVSGTSLSTNTVTFNTALNGTKVFRAVYVSKEQTTNTSTTS